MAIGNWLNRMFGAPGATPADLRKLRAASESTLAASVRGLPAGERGWITLAEAAHLFSTADEQYAFGEMDDAGNARLADFAARCRCLPEFMPTEGRVYFRREA
jgi:hypothetical protein